MKTESETDMTDCILYITRGVSSRLSNGHTKRVVKRMQFNLECTLDRILRCLVDSKSIQANYTKAKTDNKFEKIQRRAWGAIRVSRQL